MYVMQSRGQFESRAMKDKLFITILSFLTARMRNAFATDNWLNSIPAIKVVPPATMTANGTKPMPTKHVKTRELEGLN